jgi:inosine triphosphate pyrophosphatase
MPQEPLYFITSSKSKYEEAKAVIPTLEHLCYDLPEIQEINAKAIIEAKLKEAFKICSGQFIVEDTSLYLGALNGLPGPLIKWFQLQIGNEGIVNLATLLKNSAATAMTCIGYAKTPAEVHFFKSELKGNLSMPRGNGGFGWDPIFIPSGTSQTFAEMDPALKNSLSMRRSALEKLNEFLHSK